jgi:hypothetical protein
MKKTNLQSKYYMYGNKGAVWSNEAHIAHSGESVTLCGTPMLASNWAQIEQIEHIGCISCLKEYNIKTSIL